MLRCRAAERAAPRPKKPVFWLLGLLWLLGAAGCTDQHRAPGASTAAALGTGHFEGTIRLEKGPVASFKLALELRLPRPGHYEAEVLSATQSSLNFVADTIDFQAPTLRLVRPGRAGQALTLTREGDFWRGTLTLDSAQLPVLLLRRGAPAPAVYRVSRPREAALGAGALLFAPADESLAGPALALLPAAAHAALAAQWADVLARAGVIVLLLPAPADSTVADSALALAALRTLRQTPGADTARLGMWATAGRAAGLLRTLAQPHAPPLKFLVLQQLSGVRELRPLLRQLPKASPVLGLYDDGAPGSRRNSAALRAALPRRGSTRVRVTAAGQAGDAVAEWLGPAGQ